MVQFNPIESLFSGGSVPGASSQVNATRLKRDPHAPTPEQREAERAARRQRMRERNERVKEAMKFIRPDPGAVEKFPEEDLEELVQDHPSLRKLGWGGFSGSGNTINYADPGDDYDMWQQAYRMLGGFIDCDHQKSESDSHDSGDNDDNDDGGDSDQACSRWMLWAAVCQIGSSLSLCYIFSYLLSSCLFRSISIRTIRAMDIMNTSGTVLSELWIVTTRTLNGNFLEFTVKSFTSSLSKFQSIFGPLTNTSML